MSIISDAFAKDAARRGDKGEVSIVQRTPELERVLRLPWRQRDEYDPPDLSPLFVKDLKYGHRLRPIQNRMLWEAAAQNGLFAAAGCGAGKTLTSLLLPSAMLAARPLLIIPASMTVQLGCDWARYDHHFSIPGVQEILGLKSNGQPAGGAWLQSSDHQPVLMALTYERLQRVESKGLLEAIKPDLVIADEAHWLRNLHAVRTRRVRDYAAAHPECAWVFMSGTMTTRSIMDYAHLLELALRARAPLPSRKHYHELVSWAAAIDPGMDGEPEGEPGALRALQAPGESLRGAFSRRLVSTPGVVASGAQDVPASLSLCRRSVQMSRGLTARVAELSKTWCVGSGPTAEEITTSAEYTDALRQLLCGFYYRWEHPDSASKMRWCMARKDWRLAVRELVRGRQVLSEGEALQELRKSRFVFGRRIEAAWTEWETVRQGPQPKQLTVWEDHCIVQDAEEWMRQLSVIGERGVVWYEYDALGEELSRRGWPVFAGGDRAARELADTKHPVIVCSRKAHGTGKNLQTFDHALVMTPMPNGQTWEQLLARHHRPGQRADAVFFDIMLHHDLHVSAMRQAVIDAEYEQETIKIPQKLLLASKGFQF